MNEILRRRRAMMEQKKGDIVLIEYLQAPSSPVSAGIVVNKMCNEIDKISVDILTTEASNERNIVIASWNTSNSAVQNPRLAPVQAGCNGYTITQSISADVRGNLEATINSASTNYVRIGAWESSLFSKARTYYGVKLYKNSVLIADYKPAYRTSDNATGVYDAVSDTFIAEDQNLQGYVRGPAI